MGYEEILKVSDDGKYRVKLVLDEDAFEPYDDGQSPLLRLEWSGYRYRAEHVMATGRPTDHDERIEEAASKWGSELEKFEKYLRAFYGASQVIIDTSTSQGMTYITYDTAEWREHVGAPLNSVNMDEYLAYCVGDCWGYVIEKNELWRKDGDPDETMESWEHVDSCWGFYGDYSREAALEEFGSFLDSIVPAPRPWWRRALAWFWLARS